MQDAIISFSPGRDPASEIAFFLQMRKPRLRGRICWRTQASKAAELPSSPERVAPKAVLSTQKPLQDGLFLQGGAERSQQPQAGLALLFPPQSLDMTCAQVVPSILSCGERRILLHGNRGCCLLWPHVRETGSWSLRSTKVGCFSHVRLLWPHGTEPARLLCPWDSPGKNTGVDCHALLQGIFPTQ